MSIASAVKADAAKAKSAITWGLSHLHKALQYAITVVIPAIEKTDTVVEGVTALVDPQLVAFETQAYAALGAVATVAEQLDSSDMTVSTAAQANLTNLGYDSAAISALKADWATIKTGLAKVGVNL